jgi:hypothetical protein
MTTTDFNKESPYQWKTEVRKPVHYDWGSARRRFSESPQHVKRYVTARNIVGTVAGRWRLHTGALASSSTIERLRPEFTALVERWRSETGFMSSLDEKILHPAYQSIIAMGFDAVPLVLD